MGLEAARLECAFVAHRLLELLHARAPALGQGEAQAEGEGWRQDSGSGYSSGEG